tara:strand:- start:44 stop:367 length:324 start_codon:yes stop_codon:yes gene_type:complete
MIFEEKVYGDNDKVVKTITLEERQEIAQKYYTNILQDYDLFAFIGHNYRWKGIINSYVRKYKLKDIFDAMNTAEYYLHGDKAHHDSHETVKNYTSKIGGILYNRGNR